jgi:hypothetical protein
LVNGQFFGLFYASAFALLDEATWWLGALFGTFHGALTVIIPLLPGIHPRMASERSGPTGRNTREPPGLLALNYGRERALVTIVAHALFGAILGIFLQPS